MVQCTYLLYLSLQMSIRTDDMDLAGDIVQSLATYMDIMVSVELLIICTLMVKVFLNVYF